MLSVFKVTTGKFEIASVVTSVTHGTSVVGKADSYQELMSFGLVGRENQITKAWASTVFGVNIKRLLRTWRGSCLSSLHPHPVSLRESLHFSFRLWKWILLETQFLLTAGKIWIAFVISSPGIWSHRNLNAPFNLLLVGSYLLPCQGMLFCLN